MTYKNLDIEWDETVCDEKFDIEPKIGDAVLCWQNKSGADQVKAGTLIRMEKSDEYDLGIACIIKLEDGTVDEFDGEKVIKRKDSIEKLFDDFNRDMKIKLDMVLNRVHSINQILREAV